MSQPTCGITSIYDQTSTNPDFPPAVCTLLPGHEGWHSDGNCRWWNPKYDNPEMEITEAQTLYAADHITIDQLEQRVHAALRA